MAAETVLIIDDSAELRSVLESVLPFGGYSVLSAGTGAEGLALVAEEHPDLIMIDLELPDTNGLKILEELNEQGLTTPTIMMTGYGSEGVAARALRLGVRDYLIKPFTTEEVLSSVDRALEESRLRQEKERLASLVSGYARHFTLVFAVGRSVAGGMPLQDALQHIIEAGAFICRAETGFLLLADETSQNLRVVANEGSVPHLSEAIPPQAGDERLQPVLAEGVSVELHSTDASMITLQTSDQVRAVLQVPIRGQDRILGLLSVDRRDTDTAFGTYDQQMLMILANYAVMVLEHGRQEEKARSSREEVQRTYAYLASTAEMLEEAVLIADLDGSVQYVNPALAQMLNQTSQSLVGKQVSRLFADAEPELDLAAWLDAASDSEGDCVEFRCRLPEGQRRTLGMHLASVPGSHGESLGVICRIEEIQDGQ